MKKIIFFLSILFVSATYSMAQRGTAEPGYYPMNYSGDTWTGKVTADNEDTREITLTYTKGSKTENFTAVLPAGYSVKMKDGTTHIVKVDELIGFTVKVYYVNKTEKTPDGQKRTVANIFQLKFIADK